MSRPSATTVYYGLEFLLSMPTWVVVAIYLVSDVGLTPFQLVVMGRRWKRRSSFRGADRRRR